MRKLVKQIPTERHSPDQPLTPHTILFCSAVAKMTASLATYPHEVVRTRLQTQRRLLLQSDAPRKRSGIVRTTRKILHFEGWRGLYKGLSVNLIRTVPNSAVTMLTCVLHSEEEPYSALIAAVLPPPQIRVTDASPRGPTAIGPRVLLDIEARCSEVISPSISRRLACMYINTPNFFLSFLPLPDVIHAR